MSILMQDIRYAIRMVMKNPGFATACILTLALGIGANISAFSLVHAFMNLPQRFVEPERLAFVFSTGEDRRTEPVSSLDYFTWRDQATSFTRIELYGRTGVSMTGRGDPERVSAVEATSDLLPLLGLGARLGRLHTSAEDGPGGERVVLLTDALWQRKFESRGDVLGESIALNGIPHTIIGVLPPEFYTEQMWFEAELVTPLRVERPGTGEAGRYRALGRLRPDVTLLQAQAELDLIAAGMAQTHPATHANRGVRVRTLMDVFISPNDRLAFQGMLFAVALVLVIACANLANLQIAKATARGREFAVRRALGAGRGRIVRQLLTESLLLAGLGGAVGLLIGTWTVDLFVASLPYIPIERHEVGVNAAVLGYAAVLALVAALASGLAPALTASRASVQDSLKEGQASSSAGRSRSRLRSALVVGQLAVALPMLICCGLTLRHVQGIKTVDYGFNTERLLTVRIDLPAHRYATEAARAAFYRSAVETVEGIPGIESAGASYGVPVILFSSTRRAMIEGRETDPARPDTLAYQPTTLGFFETLEVPLRRGRFFSAGDGARGLPVGIINSRMARRYWPDEDPVGKRVALGADPAAAKWITIVGEVGDTGRTFSGEPPPPTLYLPHAQHPSATMYLAVRTSGESTGTIPALRETFRSLDSEVPIREFQTVQGLIHTICRDDRLTVGSLAGLGALSLLLASIGLYGVISFLVEQRTREIGVRVALGASHASIMRLILRRCVRLAALGIGVGVVLAVPVGLAIESQLWGVSGVDPAAYAGVSVVLLLVALLAGYLPARRATRVDPIVALRCN